jgi:hypothetical protein
VEAGTHQPFVIEGLRQVPWLHEALRRGHSIEHLTDCDKCKMNNDEQSRQAMGCGWEPRSELVQIRPWSPSSFIGNEGWRLTQLKDHEEPSTCIGYTSILPEVIEVQRARLHWKEGGGLRDFCDDTPTDSLRLAVECLEGASNECQRWAMDNPEKS